MSDIVKELVKDRFKRVDRNVRINFAIKFFSVGCTALTIVAFGEKYANGKDHVFTPMYQLFRRKRNQFFGVPDDLTATGNTKL